MKIKLSEVLVVFDLDDTLYREHDYFLSGLRAVGKKLSLVFAQDVDAIIDGLVDKKESDFWGIICKHLKLPESVKESMLWEYRLHVPDITLAPEVADFVFTVKSKAAGVAIVTDGRAVTQRLKLHALGLRDIPVYISEEYGATKPDATRFELIEEGNVGRNFVYIGDNPQKDFVTPNRMGWRTFGLIGNDANIHDQNVELLAEEYHPHHWVTSFKELEGFFY